MFTLNTSNTFKTLAIAALFACGVTAQSAMAESKVNAKVAAATPADPDFAKLDANGNGKISLKEAVKDKGISSAFDTIDANKDGNISADEHAAFKAADASKSAPAEAAGAAPGAVTEPAPAK